MWFCSCRRYVVGMPSDGLFDTDSGVVHTVHCLGQSKVDLYANRN